MKLEDLIGKVDRVVPVTPALWAWAALLGEARTRSNEGRRSARANRGAGNAQVDLLGAFSELLLLGWTRKLASSPAIAADMASHLYHPEGGREVEGADLQLPGPVADTTIGIDAKSFDCHPRKRFFAINEAKHRALGGDCAYYFCVLAAPNGRHAAIARLVPYTHVSFWERISLRAGGSPSLNLGIDQFLRDYFSVPPALGTLRAAIYPKEEIEARKADLECRARLRELVPTLVLPR